MEVITVVLVSDHELTAMAVRLLIESAGDLKFVDRTSQDDAEDLVRAAQPDVVVVDVSTADSDLSPLIRRLSSTSPATAMVVLAAFPRPAVTCGLPADSRWVGKDGNGNRILAEIRRIAPTLRPARSHQRWHPWTMTIPDGPGPLDPLPTPDPATPPDPGPSSPDPTPDVPLDPGVEPAPDPI